MKKTFESEAEITGYIKDVLTKTYWHDLWSYKASDRFTSGIPDWILCYKGRFIAIEVKKTGESPTVLQNFNLDRINACGGTAVSINSKEAFDKFFRKLLQT